MGIPEAHVEKHLLTQCKKFGLLCLKFVATGTNGAPDRIVIGFGHTIFVETKSAKGSPEKHQKMLIDEMRSKGADVRIISTREQVDALIVELIKNRKG